MQLSAALSTERDTSAHLPPRVTCRKPAASLPNGVLLIYAITAPAGPTEVEGREGAPASN